MATENQELRKAGLKVTLPRVKILQIMESSQTKHLSAEDVYKALIEADEDVGLATVYRVLTQFESAGFLNSPPSTTTIISSVRHAAALKSSTMRLSRVSKR
jgi:Fe2+ or Zn2+ uptake regulation protein